MWEFIGEIIGSLATILAVILAFILSNKERRQKSWSYIKKHLLYIMMSFSLFLIILTLIAYIASLQSKINSQENKILSQQEAINPKAINYFIDSLVEEKEKCKSAQAKTANLSVKIDSLNIIIDQKNNEIAMLKQQLQQQGHNDSVKINSLKMKLSQLEKEVKSFNKDKSNLEAELIRAKEELNQSKAEIERLEDEFKIEKAKFKNVLELMNKLESVNEQPGNELKILEMSSTDTILISKPLHLRTRPAKLSQYEATEMLKRYGFFDHDKNKNGKAIANQFEFQIINGDVIIIDKSTMLMWQQSGSHEDMISADSEEWIEKMNRIGFAGFYDWRCPTLEEAMSLMEPEKKNGDLYIDPLFDKEQSCIWTLDQVKGLEYEWNWVVNFDSGYCCSQFYDAGPTRAVRSLQISSGF